MDTEPLQCARHRYVAVIHREGAKLGHAPAALDTFLNFVCHAAVEREVFFRCDHS